MPGRPCAICTGLSPAELVDLDTLIGDPLAWPSTVWGLFEPPEGRALPASYRRFGAERVGREWLDRHGYADRVDRGMLRRHIRYDVPHVTRDVSELINVGLMRASRTQTRLPTNPVLDAGAYIRYFNAGIQVGAVAQELLVERINAMLDEGKTPDVRLLTKLADMGASFAKTQAALVAKGLKFGQEQDEDDAFRQGGDEPPARIQHHRVRRIEGEMRPVRDEGPADRERFRERALQEGRDPLV